MTLVWLSVCPENEILTLIGYLIIICYLIWLKTQSLCGGVSLNGDCGIGTHGNRRNFLRMEHTSLTPAGCNKRSEAARWSETDWRPTCSCFSFLFLSNPSVAAMKWWNLSRVTLKRRKGRNDLIKAGSSITNSTECDSRWALQSQRVIPAPPRDYSSWKCKRDEIETHTANDETYLRLAVVGGGAVRYKGLGCFFFFVLTVWKYLHCVGVAVKMLSRQNNNVKRSRTMQGLKSIVRKRILQHWNDVQYSTLEIKQNILMCLKVVLIYILFNL